MGEKPDQVEGAGEGRACVSGDEVEVRICQGALPRTEEERASALCHLRSSEPVCEPQETAASDGIEVRRSTFHRCHQNGGGNRFPSPRVALEVSFFLVADVARLETVLIQGFPRRVEEVVAAIYDAVTIPE